jgi:hypothetical protein
MKDAKNGTWKVVGVVSAILVVLLTAAVAYGMLAGDVEENTKLRPRIQELDRKVTVLETRQQTILECVQRIEAKLDERSP